MKQACSFIFFIELAMIAASTANVTSSTRSRHRDLTTRRIDYIPSEHIETYNAEITLTTEVSELLKAVGNRPASRRVVSQLGSPLALSCETPLLSASAERELFERMNHLKYQAAEQQAWLSANVAALDQFEALLREADEIRNLLIAANVRLVISIVKTYSDAKNPCDELISDGLLTLMQAIDKFDYSRGFRFSTYATRAIRRNLYRLLVQRQKERSRFTNAASDATLEVADERGESTMSEVRWDTLQRQLKRMLSRLEPRERAIVKARFGLEKTGQVWTLQMLARSLGVCKERVRQLEKRAIDKLRQMVDGIAIEEPAAT